MKPARETVYTPEPPLKNPFRLLKQIVVDNWERRELCSQLFWRNIKAQYRQTFLGFLWIFLPAIVTAAVWVFLYSFRVVQFDDGLTQSQYVAYVLVGMILWQSFDEAYSAPMGSFQQNRSMMSKINFPREVIIAVSIGEVLFNATIRSLVLVTLLFLFVGGFQFSFSMFLFPVVFMGLILTGATIGLILVPFGALYLDVGRVLTIVTPIWMILTPIIYPSPTTSPANLLVYLNVASPTLITARDYLLGATPTYQGLCWIYLASVIPVFLISILFYRISMPILLERSGN